MPPRHLLLLACVATATGPARAADGPLAVRIGTILARPQLAGSTVGLCILRPGSASPLHEHQADKLLPPASCVKLVSGAAALLTLGTDFRFTTRVVGTGPLLEGALQGDLVLVAAGDPNLSQRPGPGDTLRFRNRDHSYAGFHDAELVEGDPLQVLKKLAREAAAAGLREVHGDIVVDDGLFGETEDEFVGEISAACVNDNLLDVMVTPGDDEGAPVKVRHQPQGSQVELLSTATTGAAGTATSLELVTRPGILSFELRGKVPAGAGPVVRVAPFSRPALAAASFLADALRDAGVAIRGRPAQRRLGPAAYSEARELARHISPPFAEELKVMLKVSQNLHATLLPPLLGALHGEAGNRTAGYRVAAQALAGLGLDAGPLTLSSGSGGGRADALSARWTVQLLGSLSGRPEFPAFFAALPIGGVDGTLESAFTDGELGSRVHAKTGTLVYRAALGARWLFVAKALAGYLDLRDHPVGPPSPTETLAFAIYIANTPVADRAQGTAQLFSAQEDILRAAYDEARQTATQRQ